MSRKAAVGWAGVRKEADGAEDGCNSAISLEKVGAGFLSLRQCPSPKLSLLGLSLPKFPSFCAVFRQ
jgi:hypothetical protein